MLCSSASQYLSRASLASLLVAVMSLTLVACSDDGGNNGDTGDTPDATDTTDTTDQDDTTTVAEWADTYYRIEEISIIQPTGVGAVLAGIIQTEINRGSTHLLVETFDFSDTSGEASFQVRAGAGELVDTDSYQFVGTPPESGSATVQASGEFTTDEPILLDFPILLRLEPRCDGGVCPDGMCRSDADCPQDGDFTCDSEDTGSCLQFIIVPLNDLTFDGQFEEEDGVAVLKATDLAGAILKSDADEIFIEIAAGSDPISLTSLLQEGRMDYPVDSENPTGWILTIIINATAVQAAE